MIRKTDHARSQIENLDAPFDMKIITKVRSAAN